MMVTEKQMTANRSNAVKSTGPKSAVGKSTVSRNAIKHGLLSEKLLLRGEAEQDLNLLVRSLEKGVDVWGAGARLRGDSPESNLAHLLVQAGEVSEDKRALLTDIVVKYQKCLGRLWSTIREHAIHMLDIYFRETFFPGSLAVSRYSSALNT